MAQTTTLTLTEFLAARLGDDEAVAGAMGGRFHWFPEVNDVGGVVLDAHRLRREVKAKRAVIDDAFRYEATIDGERGCCHSAEQIRAGACGDMRPGDITALRHLAAIYADHPDYDEEWKP